MGKLLGPDFISLQVRDLAASRTFYTEVLGMTIDPRFPAPDVVVFDSNTIPFAIRSASVDLGQAPQPGWGVALWLDCDNIDELCTRLEEAGATILQRPFDGPFGRTLIFADPDGYRITANQNPWDRIPLGGRR